MGHRDPEGWLESKKKKKKKLKSFAGNIPKNITDNFFNKVSGSRIKSMGLRRGKKKQKNNTN